MQAPSLGFKELGALTPAKRASSEGEESVRSFRAGNTPVFCPQLGAESLFRLGHSFSSPLSPRHFSRISCKQAFRETIRSFRFELPEQPPRRRALLQLLLGAVNMDCLSKEAAPFPYIFGSISGHDPEQ